MLHSISGIFHGTEYQAKRPTPINSIPFELISYIFSFLDVYDQGRCGLVCQNWFTYTIDYFPQVVIRRELAKLVRKTNLLVFGKNDWNRFYDIGKEPPLPLNIIEILQSQNSLTLYNDFGKPLRDSKSIAETHHLVLIPKAVDGNPLSSSLITRMVTTHSRLEKVFWETLHLFSNYSWDYPEIAAAADEFLSKTNFQPIEKSYIKQTVISSGFRTCIILFPLHHLDGESLLVMVGNISAN